ncbi:MAG TPA: hypothetical protein VM534_09060 [Thermoanaerobaculia bacterium]|nr:hypothetical protein [Thermoanaerobaculia bacterium]
MRLAVRLMEVIKMWIHRRNSLLLFAAFVLFATPLLHAGSEADPRAVEIARRVREAMGGDAGWDQARFFRFDFNVENKTGEALSSRSHFWDKLEGRHRVEGKTREGQSFLVLHDLDTREGRAWLDGTELDGDAKKDWLERAYAQWVNDTYWLLMPWKMLDPGVILRFEGERTVGDERFQILHLRFENVGLTPGDQYWALIDPESGLMRRWEYVLQGSEPPPVAWEWNGWQRYGPILLAPDRNPVAGERQIMFRNLAVLPALPDSVFESPEPVVLTAVVVRAVSRDAKIIGSGVGGARITIRDVATGVLLAEGIQEGGTGDTRRIITEPHVRGESRFETPGAAAFRALLPLERPTRVEVIAEAPLGTPQSTQRSSKTLLLVPGHDVTGDGIVLEIHGFTVEIQRPQESDRHEAGEELEVRTRLTMT